MEWVTGLWWHHLSSWLYYLDFQFYETNPYTHKQNILYASSFSEFVCCQLIQLKKPNEKLDWKYKKLGWVPVAWNQESWLKKEKKSVIPLNLAVNGATSLNLWGNEAQIRGPCADAPFFICCAHKNSCLGYEFTVFPRSLPEEFRAISAIVCQYQGCHWKQHLGILISKPAFTSLLEIWTVCHQVLGLDPFSLLWLSADAE